MSIKSTGGQFYLLTAELEQYLRSRPDLAGWLAKISLSACGFTLVAPDSINERPQIFRNSNKLLLQLRQLRRTDPKWFAALYKSNDIEDQTLFDFADRYPAFRPFVDLLSR